MFLISDKSRLSQPPFGRFLTGFFILAMLAQLVCPASLAKDEMAEPGKGVEVSGVPKIPQKLANELSRFTNFRSATLADWHPVLKEMLVITSLCQASQVHKVAMPAGERFQLTFEEDNILWLGAATRSASYDPVDGKFFIFSKDARGNENNQNYRYDFETGNITLLTDGKSRNTPGVWSHSGKLVAYESNRRTGVDMDLYVVDPRKPDSDRLVSVVGGGGWTILDWSPDDRQILVRRRRSIHESYLWIFDIESGSAKLVAPASGAERIAYSEAQFDKDGTGLYVLTDKDSEFLRLAHLDIASGEHTYISGEINWDVDHFRLSWARDWLAYTGNENGLSILYIMNCQTGEVRKMDGMPEGIISDLIWHRDGVTLGFSFDSRTSPHDAYSINIESRDIERWTISETGGINPETFDCPELTVWKGFDDLEFSGYLYRPPAKFTGKRPVIVYFHGGPEGQYRPGFIGSSNYYLNELGIAILYPNVRGSLGYGKSFLKLDDGMLRGNAYKDIATVLDWIGSQPDLDSDRIMIMGRSYGGHLALAAAALYSDRIRCAVDVVGPSSLVTFLENTSGYRQDLRRQEYGDERKPKVRKYLERISPLNKADKITKPLLVIQGARDPRVPMSESTQMVKRVQKHGVPIWYMVAKKAGHKFAKRNLIRQQFFTTVLFVKEYLLGEKISRAKRQVEIPL